MARSSRTEERMRETRHRFLTSCGKSAMATPPVVTLLLNGPEQNYTMASSGFHNVRPDSDFGSGGFDNVLAHARHLNVNR